MNAKIIKKQITVCNYCGKQSENINRLGLCWNCEKAASEYYETINNEQEQ